LGVRKERYATISSFIKHHYRHFNAPHWSCAEAYNALLASAARCSSPSRAMSTAELGLSLAEMIRQDKIHGICCTGANLEKMFSISWLMIFTSAFPATAIYPADEASLLSRHMNRVTTPASRRWRPSAH